MKKKPTWIIICAFVVIFVFGLFCFEPLQEFVNTKKPDKIDADTVIMLHSSDGDLSSQEVTITDKETVSELLSMHNSLKVLYMSRPMAEERMKLIFYKDDKIINEWCISFYEEDGMLITYSNAFPDKGNHVVKSEFIYTRLVEIFNNATA